MQHCFSLLIYKHLFFIRHIFVLCVLYSRKYQIKRRANNLKVASMLKRRNATLFLASHFTNLFFVRHILFCAMRYNTIHASEWNSIFEYCIISIQLKEGRITLKLASILKRIRGLKWRTSTLWLWEAERCVQVLYIATCARCSIDVWNVEVSSS